MNIDHSYHFHISDEEVINRANIEMNKECSITGNWQQLKVAKEVSGEHYKEITLVGDLIFKRQEILLGHIFRLPINDLMRKVTFDANLKRPYQLYERVGHPRSNWTDDNLQRAHLNYGWGEGEFDIGNQKHVDLIKHAATMRVF